MPIEKAKVTFYRVPQCGFYARGEENPSFGSLQSMLTDLQSWSRGKQLAATKTFEVADGADFLPVYLMDINSDADSCVITIWNQTPSTEGQVAAAIGTSNVGDAKVVMNNVPAGGIPGFATYFWFVPGKNVFASVRFQHLVTGQKPMQLYMESFQEAFSKHVAWTDPQPGVDIEVAGYMEKPGDVVQDLNPRFRSQLLRKPGMHDYIIQNAGNIRKVLRKTTLKLDRPEDLSNWQQFLDWTHIRAPQIRPDQVKVQYELPADLSRQDVEAMIDDWNAGHEREWDDYGFKMKGSSQTPFWLSHSLARKEFELDVKRNSLEVVNSDSLITALNQNRAELMQLIE